MKLQRKLVSLSMAVLLCALSLTSCKITVKQGDNGLYDKKNDIHYISASTVYEAKGLDREYGELQITKDIVYTLYTIPDVPPTDMLATEERDVLYADTLTMPTLADMKPETAYVCVVGTTTVHTLFSIDDPSAIARLVDTYTKGSELTNPSIRPQKDYRIRFESTEHPGFYYTLTYVEYDEDLVLDGVSYGKYFLLSNFEKTFVPIDDTIHVFFDGGSTAGPAIETDTPADNAA